MTQTKTHPQMKEQAAHDDRKRIPEPELFGYEDIELYYRVILGNSEGYVIDKGKDVLPDVPGKHLEIEFIGKQQNVRLPESIVNKRLNEQSRLWVDWDHRLTGYDNA